MTTSELRWMPLLRAEAERTSIADIAKRLGYSRTSISLVLAGRYPGGTERIAAAVLAELDGWTCPHLQQPIKAEACQEIAFGPAPTHHPMKLTHWRACQNCSNRL
ncbi:XRE family transcriptional regulator [Neisseriaceae bacterium JH1-16]|nr:XRE family transcriptional regulator [Neisseriaceae bacterium JH1-16]